MNDVWSEQDIAEAKEEAKILYDYFHPCKTALIADITEPAKGEFYIMLGEGNHDCERWRLTESLARKLRKALNSKLD